MKYSIGSEVMLAQAMNKIVTHFEDDEIVEMSSLQHAFFQQIQIGGQLAKCMNTHPLVEALRISPDVQQCAFEVWANLFEFYFDFLGLQQYYTVKTNTIIRELKNPGKDDSVPRRSVKKEIFKQT